VNFHEIGSKGKRHGFLIPLRPNGEWSRQQTENNEPLPTTQNKGGKKMSADISDLTIQYEEEGQILVKELDKEVLTKGAWATIIFRYQNWSRSKNEFSKEMFTIRRYQKRNGEYVSKSKFNISSADQAKKIITILQKWIDQ